MTRIVAVLALVGVCVVPSLALAEPAERDTRGAEGIRADLERIVHAEEGEGWFLDSEALEEAYPVLLETVCRATEAARREALEQLRGEVEKADDPEELFEEAGELTSEAKKALTLRRELMLLETTIAGAERDCPFWVVPEPGYDGRQTDRNQFTINFESGGMAQVRQTEGSWTYGGGGAARLLVGYGFGPVTLLGGGEFGGGALLNRGSSQKNFSLNFFPAMPLVLRFRNVAWHYDLEVAGLGWWETENRRLSYGVRIGGGAGISASRTRGIIPWAGVALNYDHYFENPRRSRAHFLRGGLRVGFQFGL